MTYDTSTVEGRQKRTEQLVEHYKKLGNDTGIQRIIGGVRGDQRDYILGLDDGEEPETHGVEPYKSPDPEIEAMSEAELYESNEVNGAGH